MPKKNRGGRRANNTPTPMPVVQQATATSGGGGGGGNIGPRNYTNMTNADAQNLRDQQDSMYNGSVTAAVKMYISGQPNTPAANIDGKGHSMSQTMNYLMEQGEDLSATDVNTINRKYGLRISDRWFASMQYTQAYMDAGAHALGKDTLLTRGAHDDILKNEFGITNYQNMSEAQLKAALVGGTFTNKAFMSTSYDPNKSPFLSSSSGVSGGREVIIRVKAGANTNVLLGSKVQAEVILARGQNFKINDISFTGNYATPRGGGVKKQIVIDIETI